MKIVHWGFLAVLVGTSFLLSLFEIRNDDAGFHVANGLWILDHGQVPLHNPFTFSDDGAIWTQHQWLSALWMASTVNAFGPQGLIIWKACLVGLTFAVLGFGLRRIPLFWASFFAFIAIGACCYRFVERPYLITMLLMAINLQALIRWRRDSSCTWAIWLAGLSTIASLHFHAGGFYNLLLLVALGAEVVIARGKFRGNTTPDNPGKTVAGILCIVAGSIASLWLFAPSGLDVIALPFGFSKHAYWNNHLGEFRPFPLHWEATPQWFLILGAYGLATNCIRKKNFFAAFALVGFALLATRHARMIYPLAVVVLSILSCVQLPSLPRNIIRIPVLTVALFMFVFGASSHLERVNFGLGTDGFDRGRHPIELMELSRDMPGETFVSDGLAGTWLWVNFDDSLDEPVKQRRVLIHNCLECYQEETYRDVYQFIRYGKEGWAEKADELGINSYLLKHTSPGERRMQGGKPNLRQHLFHSPDWLLVNFDDVASLYVRKTLKPAKLDGLPEFPVDPDSWKPRRFDTPWPALRAALLDHSHQNPTQTRALVIACQLSTQVNDLETLEEAAREIVSRAPESKAAEVAIRMLKQAVK